MLLESKCALKGVFTGFWLFMETGTVLPGTGTGVRKHFFLSLFFFLFLGCVCVLSGHQMLWHMSVILSFRKKRQEDQKLRVIFG